MNIHYFADDHKMGAKAHDIILQALHEKPGLLLCAATGHSPLSAYQLLAESYNKKPALFTKLRILKLDEWGGVGMTDPQTCESFLQNYLLNPLKISKDRYFGFISNIDDPQAECARIQTILEEQGPIDLCVLGLGRNGHIAFNEPTETLNPNCHIAKLSQDSMRHSMAQAMAKQPTYGLTLGMADIFNATQILLLVSGNNKKTALEKLLKSEITTHLPASLLWLHPNVDCLIDENILS